MVKLILDDLTEYELNRLWIPENLFNYSSQGNVERQEGTTETFFYGDKRPEAQAFVFRFSKTFESVANAVQWVKSVEAVLPSVELLNYDFFDIGIKQAFLSWNFGARMNEVQARLMLIPNDVYGWAESTAIIMRRADIFMDRSDIFMDTLRGT